MKKLNKENVRVYLKNLFTEEETSIDFYFPSAKKRDDAEGRNTAWVEFDEFWDVIENERKGMQVGDCELIA